MTAIRIVNEDAPPLLAKAVRDWLARCRYQPTLKDGQPIDQELKASFVFKPPAPPPGIDAK